MSVINWLKKFGSMFDLKPQIENCEAVTIEIDEMWHYVQKKSANYGYGKSSAEITDILSIGSVVIVALKSSVSSTID